MLKHSAILQLDVPQSGRYEVVVLLELPHLDDAAARKVTTICVNSSAVVSYGLGVLSDNNPLTKCPTTNYRLDGKTGTFDIVSEGTNAARASAKYTFDLQSFEGWRPTRFVLEPPKLIRMRQLSTTAK